jgi:hypothetical protein
MGTLVQFNGKTSSSKKTPITFTSEISKYAEFPQQRYQELRYNNFTPTEQAIYSDMYEVIEDDIRTLMSYFSEEEGIDADETAPLILAAMMQVSSELWKKMKNHPELDVNFSDNMNEFMAQMQKNVRKYKIPRMK